MDIVAVGLICEGANTFGGPQLVGLINNLDVLEVAGLAKAFLGEMTAAHLCGCVLPIWLRVHHLPSPLYHGGTVCKVGEEEGRPVT